MITKGKCEVANNGKGFDMEGMRHLFIRSGDFTIGRIDGHKDGLSCGHEAISMDDASDNAALICEAFNVYNETGLMPSELVAQRKDCLALLRDILTWDGILDHSKVRISDAIAATGKN